MKTETGSRPDELLAELTLEEKCILVGGASSWRTHPIERVGVPEIKMSDGPNGVRGEFTGTEMTPAVLVPVGIVQGATWDPELIRRVGDVLGRETRRRTAHVLLAPAVNLHRTPIGGRTFEYFSEDPELTAALATATVQAVQAHDVAVTVKHFAVNDTEVDRNTVNVVVDDRTLRELYLRPFEAAVVDGGAWGVMSAYNQYDGDFCGANDRLLNQILRREWGFDGFVVSDWFGAHDATASANGGLSIEMPGPTRVYGRLLHDAVAAGRVDERTVDALARDVLVLAERTHAFERSADAPEESVDDAQERALCRETAIAGTVLARNEHAALPLAPGPVALIGPNAATTRTMGGGSSALEPLPQRSILEAFADRWPDVVHAAGCAIDKHAPVASGTQLIGPDGEPGLVIEFLVDGEDEPRHRSRSMTSSIRFFGSVPSGVGTGPCTLRVRGSFVPEVTGEHVVGAIVTGRPNVEIGGHHVIEAGADLGRGDAFFGFGSEEITASVDAVAGEPVAIAVDLPMKRAFGAVRLGFHPPRTTDLLAEAETVAAGATAVLVVGTTDEWETEGHDRSTIALPGDQDELVRRVAAVAERTVVVVNAGAPVAMPWIDDVDAVLLPFFGGMEMGDAVVDVLTGEADPGGRLPITFPVALEDTPAWPHYAPVDGVQTYGEGLHMGYRGFDRSGLAPLFAFGHGLSYGDDEWGTATVDVDRLDAGAVHAGPGVTLSVPVRSTGDRPVTTVVQCYVAPVDPPVERPHKELRGWAKHRLEPGEETTASIRLGWTAFRRWDPTTDGWVVDPGDYDLVVARSATDEVTRVRITLT